MIGHGKVAVRDDIHADKNVRVRPQFAMSNAQWIHVQTIGKRQSNEVYLAQSLSIRRKCLYHADWAQVAGINHPLGNNGARRACIPNR